MDIIRTAESFLAERGTAQPFGAVVPGFEPLSEDERHAKAAALAPVIRGLASTDAKQSGEERGFRGPEQRGLRCGQGRPGAPGAAARRRAGRAGQRGQRGQRGQPRWGGSRLGIFAKGWGAQRAKVYGVPEEELGEFYAQRTILKREVLPEHVAAAVFALAAGDLTHTTGLHSPVDAGVAVDLGATSGRVMVGTVTPDRLDLEEVHRFPNGPVTAEDGSLRWDIERLHREVLDGLHAAGPADAVGIDSWAVDYGLLDASGTLLDAP